MASVELVCEVCGVAYRRERKFGGEWDSWIRRNGSLLERGYCGRCFRGILRVDKSDRREELARKVKYVHGAGYVNGVLAEKKQIRRKQKK